ncbi:MAG: RagB/SusD family nutrient uptake outer membrane protein [Tannerella sp.]|jgi:hypothetical protein|nr:RagB/SusD family nutrient uptake outer membrane protein [Tannerella sp.]
MKKIVYSIIIAALGGLTSCLDILDTAPYNQQASQNMWTTETLADNGVLGVYYSLRGSIKSDGMIGNSGANLGWWAWDVLGMTAQTRLAAQNIFLQSVTPSNARFDVTWRWGYNGVHRANDALANLPKSPIPAAKRERLIAEVKVMRAFFYMRLNELFGNNGVGVPLYTEPVDPAQCTKPQSPENEIWAQILKDLTEAIDSKALPNNEIQKEGRVSLGAAHAFRGRARLMNKDYQGAAEDFQKVGECGYKLFPNYYQLFKEANERCEEIIFSEQSIDQPAGFGNAQLQRSLAAYNAGGKNGNGWTDIRVTNNLVDLYETVNADGTVKDFNWDDYISGYNAADPLTRRVYFMRDTLVNGKGIHSSITNLVNTNASLGLPKVPAADRSKYLPEGNEARLKKVYANRDPRLKYNVICPYDTFIGKKSDLTGAATYVFRYPRLAKAHEDQATSESSVVGNGMLSTLVMDADAEYCYIFRKWVGEGINYIDRDNVPVDAPIIRYGDVLLMWAEALVELNRLPDAKDKVKQVRDRAGIATPDAKFADQNTARNYVRDERRRELMGEGVNFFDEMRWRTLEISKFGQKYGHNIFGDKTASTSNYEWIPDGRWYTWPVPKAEVELNPNLNQTPGWIYQ